VIVHKSLQKWLLLLGAAICAICAVTAVQHYWHASPKPLAPGAEMSASGPADEQATNELVEDRCHLPGRSAEALPALPENAGPAGPPAKTTDTSAFSLSRVANQDKPLVLIAVSEQDTWLFAAAAPIAARLRQLGKTPILLALASEDAPAQTKLLGQLAGVCGPCLMLTSDPNLAPEQIRQMIGVEILATDSEPVDTGLLLTECLWPRTQQVVVASLEDFEAVIMGATLASHLVVPFVPAPAGRDWNVFAEELKLLDVRHILLVDSDGRLGYEFSVEPEQTVELFDTSAVQMCLVDEIGSANVHNVLVFRVPEGPLDEHASSWLVPYLSLMRGAVAVPCYSEDALAAEGSVRALIDACALKPRTVTIVGHRDSIGMIAAKVTSESQEYEYEIMTEPCSLPAEGAAAEMGVGRMPFHRLWAASTFAARCFARDHILAGARLAVQMIANPNRDMGSLPLCETISRATAAEFKNFNIHIDEFYGVNLSDQRLRDSTRTAHLVIFEGHLSDLTLFTTSSEPADMQYFDDGQWEEIDDYNRIEIMDSTYEQKQDYGDPSQWEDDSAQFEAPVHSPDDDEDPDLYGMDTSFEDFPDHAEEVIEACQLDSLPLIILQSCHSLEDAALRVLTADSIGVVGSVTSIHSASGSAFIKAFCDGLLYRGDTAGEALRDARNYLLCVGALKTARGHTQQAKVIRVAYSFHLWADPETTLLRGSPARPRLQPVSATFIAADKIHIATPEKRLSTCRTEKYILRSFAGSEAAGIVKRLKGQEVRKVLPLYFFRIPLPADFQQWQYTALGQADEQTARAVFLSDPFKRFLYVVYLPEKDEPCQDFLLEFHN